MFLYAGWSHSSFILENMSRIWLRLTRTYLNKQVLQVILMTGCLSDVILFCTMFGWLPMPYWRLQEAPALAQVSCSLCCRYAIATIPSLSEALILGGHHDARRHSCSRWRYEASQEWKLPFDACRHSPSPSRSPSSPRQKRLPDTGDCLIICCMCLNPLAQWVTAGQACSVALSLLAPVSDLCLLQQQWSQHHSLSSYVFIVQPVLRLGAGRGVSCLYIRQTMVAVALQEVLLLKRDMMSRDIVEQWHAERPSIEGGTLGDSPIWAGTWVVDVICRVSDGSDHNIWLKSLDRTIAASPESSFIQQFTL